MQTKIINNWREFASSIKNQLVVYCPYATYPSADKRKDIAQLLIANNKLKIVFLHSTDYLGTNYSLLLWLLEIAVNCPYVQQLYLPNNLLGQASHEIFSRFCELLKLYRGKALDLSDNKFWKLSQEQVTELFKAISCNNNLILLDLSNNGLEEPRYTLPANIQKLWFDNSSLKQNIAQLEKELENNPPKATTESNLDKLSAIAKEISLDAVNLLIAKYYFYYHQFFDNPDKRQQMLFHAVVMLTKVHSDSTLFKQAEDIYQKIVGNLQLDECFSEKLSYLAPLVKNYYFGQRLLAQIGLQYFVRKEKDETLETLKKRLAIAFALLSEAKKDITIDINLASIMAQLVGLPLSNYQSLQEIYNANNSAFITACRQIDHYKKIFGLISDANEHKTLESWIERVICEPIKYDHTNLVVEKSLDIR